MTDEKDEDAAARARAIALLEATHTFPGAYDLTVITHNREGVEADIKNAATPEGRSVSSHVTFASRQGRYVSHRLTVQVLDAAEVLTIYARVRAVVGVVTVL